MNKDLKNKLIEIGKSPYASVIKTFISEFVEFTLEENLDKPDESNKKLVKKLRELCSCLEKKPEKKEKTNQYV